jgi:hypothetical protein
MIKPLRKKHLFAWRLMAILLPAGIIVAWLSVPKQVPQSLLQPGTEIPLPVVIKTGQKENYSISIRSNENGSKFQLEWINKNILQYPTATIYAGNEIKDVSKAKLIGRIEARGNWYFPLDSACKNENHFILYDFIHQQVIDTINLKP